MKCQSVRMATKLPACSHWPRFGMMPPRMGSHTCRAGWSLQNPSWKVDSMARGSPLRSRRSCHNTWDSCDLLGIPSQYFVASRNYEPCQAREPKRGLAIAHITKGLGRMSVVFFAVLYTYYELKDDLSRSELGDFRRWLCCTVGARNCFGLLSKFRPWNTYPRFGPKFHSQDISLLQASQIISALNQ